MVLIYDVAEALHGDEGPLDSVFCYEAIINSSHADLHGKSVPENDVKFLSFTFRNKQVKGIRPHVYDRNPVFHTVIKSRANLILYFDRVLIILSPSPHGQKEIKGSGTAEEI